MPLMIGQVDLPELELRTKCLCIIYTSNVHKEQSAKGPQWDIYRGKSPKWDTPFREHYTVLWFSGGGPKTDHEMEK